MELKGDEIRWYSITYSSELNGMLESLAHGPENGKHLGKCRLVTN